MSRLPDSIQNLIDAPAPLGPDRDANALSESEVRQKAGEAIKEAGLTGTPAQLFLSAALLMNDHLDASHSISQDIGSASGSMLHGIMHRREPDYGNARYWWARTGNHPCFIELAEKVTDFLDDENADTLLNRIVRNGNWDPIGMTDAVADAERGRLDAETVQLLKQVQKLEVETLLEYELA